MVYELFERLDGFKQFNGLIGVMPAGFGELDEHASCEDFDFTQRMYLRGKTGLLVKGTRVGEQAPLRLRELYNQRVRWLNGAFQGLSRYHRDFHRARIPAGRKLAWFLSGTFPFIAFTAAPLAALFGLALALRGRASFFAAPGLMLHVWLITMCGAAVLAGNAFRKEISWKDSSRTDD